MIVRTVIGSDGSISREFRFRSQSMNRSGDPEARKTEDYRRQQSEPLEQTREPLNPSPNNNVSQEDKSFSGSDAVSDTKEKKISNGSSENAMKIEQLLRKTSLPPLNTTNSSVTINDDEQSSEDNQKSSDRLANTSENETLEPVEINKSQGNIFVQEAIINVKEPEQCRSEPERKKSVLDEITTIIEEENLKLNKLLKDEKQEKVSDPIPQKENVPDNNVEVAKKEPKVSFTSSLDFQLPANTFYQTKVPSSSQSQDDSISVSNSMLDFCIDRSEKKKSEKKIQLNNSHSFRNNQSPSKPPLSSSSRHRRHYQRSKSYAGLGNNSGGVVSLSQCPLCGRQFEKYFTDKYL